MQNVSAIRYFEEGSGIVTLCGSTKYFEQCMEANRALTFQNWVVLMCGSWGHSYHKGAENLNRDYFQVKKLHFHEILESDAIVVVSDKSGYYGESTTEEIAFAEHRNKPVFYHNGDRLINWQVTTTIPNRYSDSSLIDSFRLKLVQHN